MIRVTSDVGAVRSIYLVRWLVLPGAFKRKGSFRPGVIRSFPGVNCVESETWDFGGVAVATKRIQAK